MNIVNLGPAAQWLADLVARIDDDEMVKPTPCPAYTVGDLIDHVGGLALAGRDPAGHLADPGDAVTAGRCLL